MTNNRVVVIGGGPAGLMASGEAAKAGTQVLILEKMKRTGRKLSITGKGRCNITNVAPLPEFIEHFGRTGRFLRQAFSCYFAPELVEFLEGLGLPLVTERGGRVFPKSGLAPDVVAALTEWVRSSGVHIRKSAPVARLDITGGRVTGVVVGEETIPCESAVLATGGASYPDTGSTGDGYRIARDAGHKIITVRPALVPLETAGTVAQKMAGLDLRNVGVRVYKDGKKFKSAFGEMSIFNFGVGGPVINTVSGPVVDALREGAGISLSIDLKPALDDKKLDARLIRDFSSRGAEEIRSVLRGLVPREMVAQCLDATRIAPERKASEVNSKERRRLRVWLKELKLEVTKARPIAEAIVTAGGVDTREVNPRTMESRLVKGLFFAGEVLDIQADTGGYNLQAAFSTGWLAGRAAAALVTEKSE